MSRLLDQLKRASQSREAAASVPGTSPTLLQKALERAATEPVVPPQVPPPADAAPRDSADPLEQAIPARSTMPPPSASWRPAAAMVVVIGALVAVAWHATRQGEAPKAHQPKLFQLDYQLDLNRTGGASRSSPPGPDPSK